MKENNKRKDLGLVLLLGTFMNVTKNESGTTKCTVKAVSSTQKDCITILKDCVCDIGAQKT